MKKSPPVYAMHPGAITISKQKLLKIIVNTLGVIIFASFTSIVSATLLDFNNQYDLGVTLGGEMVWTDINGSGGHIYNEGLRSVDYVIFFEDTYVNSFEMNATPWKDFGGGGGTIDIAGMNSSNQTVWSTTVDLAGYSDWSNWLTVSVETAGIAQLVFNPPNNNGRFWPSIDNMIINEQALSTPIPAAAWLFGSGLLGLVGIARHKKA